VKKAHQTVDPAGSFVTLEVVLTAPLRTRVEDEMAPTVVAVKVLGVAEVVWVQQQPPLQPHILLVEV
jgi:hypothetical protein